MDGFKRLREVGWTLGLSGQKKFFKVEGRIVF